MSAGTSLAFGLLQPDEISTGGQLHTHIWQEVESGSKEGRLLNWFEAREFAFWK